MTVTTYQDYVRPTMTPTEGSGKVYLRFENLPKAAGGPTLGPYPYVVLSFESVRVGPDKVEVALAPRVLEPQQGQQQVDRCDHLL